MSGRDWPLSQNVEVQDIAIFAFSVATIKQTINPTILNLEAKKNEFFNFFSSAMWDFFNHTN
jgi:hypothetical protein